MRGKEAISAMAGLEASPYWVCATACRHPTQRVPWAHHPVTAIHPQGTCNALTLQQKGPCLSS